MPADEQGSPALLRLIRVHMPRVKAPDELRARVLADISRGSMAAGTVPSPAPRRPMQIGKWLSAAALVLVAGTAYIAGSYWGLPPTNSEENAVLAAHARSLQSGNLTQVVSTDEHTVKPWFNGKLDFSPSVVRLEADSFPLIGGRVDHLGERTVAALVYGRRAHKINVFTYPSPRVDRAVQHESKNGWQVIDWRAGGMEYWVVSDLNSQELNAFAVALAAGVRSP